MTRRGYFFVALVVFCGPGLAFADPDGGPGDSPAPEPSPEDCSIPIWPDKLWLSPTGTSPDVSGSKVVWQEADGSNLDIWAYDAETCVTTHIINSIENEQVPAISGEDIVYLKGLFSLQYWAGDSESESEISQSLGGINGPSISEEWVVWSETPLSDGSPDWDIYLWDGSKTKVSLNPDFDNAGKPNIDVGDVVWEAEGTNWDVFWWDGTFPIDEDSSENLTSASDALAGEIGSGVRDDLSPRVSEGRVVWARCLQEDHEDCTITMKSLDSDSSFGTLVSSEGTNPDISNRGVVYQKKTEVELDFETIYPTAIHYWNGSETEQLSILGTKRNPRIDGDNIVWETSPGGIFFTRLPEPSADLLGVVALTALAICRRFVRGSLSAISHFP